jgi:hypothetical protein
MKLCLLVTLPLTLVFTSCASHDPNRPDPTALQRRETRLFDDPTPLSENPDSPLNSVQRQQGRVGIPVTTF